MAKTATIPAPTETPTTNGSLTRPDPIAALMASLVPADLSLFSAPKIAPKVNEYLPAVKLSNEGRDADGIGTAFQFPLTFGESGAVSAKMRRAGRDLGLAVQVRWAPADAELYNGYLALCEKHAEATEDGRLARSLRDGSAGVLAFRTAPQVKRDKSTGQVTVS